MPTFSNRSMFKLSTCHEDLQVLFKYVIENMDCTILEGHRTRKAQEVAYQAGKSRLQYPNSRHNSVPSMAVDVIAYPLDWGNYQRHLWFAGYVLGVADRLYAEGLMKHKLRLGADWDRDYDITDEKGLRDLVHFEIIA